METGPPARLKLGSMASNASFHCNCFQLATKTYPRCLLWRGDSTLAIAVLHDPQQTGAPEFFIQSRGVIDSREYQAMRYMRIRTTPPTSNAAPATRATLTG